MIVTLSEKVHGPFRGAGRRATGGHQERERPL